jgi:hypothetical protein
MTVVIALDIAKNTTGWALGGPDWDRPQYGVFQTSNWDKRQGVNLHAFRGFLEAKTEAHTITHLVVERIFVDVRGATSKAFNFSGTESQLMLAGVALEWAEGCGIHQARADVSDWRMRFLGMNHRPKDNIKDAMFWKNLAMRRCAELGWWVDGHDAAEALGILDFALAALDKDYRLRTNPRHARAQRDIDLKKGLHA